MKYMQDTANDYTSGREQDDVGHIMTNLFIKLVSPSLFPYFNEFAIL